MEQRTDEARSASIGFYKNSAALRIRIKKVQDDENGFPEPGGYFLHFAPAFSGGKNKYDWEKGGNSIYIYISSNEAMKFCRMLTDDQSIRIYHDPDKGTNREGTRAKTLSANMTDTSLFLNITSGNKKVGIALAIDEITTIVTLFRLSLPACIGW